MKIVKYKSKGDNRFWVCCPPSLECTTKQAKRITKIWKFFNKNSYIVDPLGEKQCLYIKFKEIPFHWLVLPFIKKETVIRNESDNR
jgi:hypothetical protein